MSDSNETPPAGETSDLQFDHADFDSASVDDAGVDVGDTPGATLQCASCNTELSQVYFAVGDAAMCGHCKQDLAAAIENRTQPARFIRALGYGVPAAMLGSAIYYAILAVTDYEIGLVAILIGFMVGAAVRTASGPGGGRRYQLLAAGLTYCAIVTTYVPFVIEGFQEVAAEEMEVAAADAGATESADAVSDSADASTLPPAEVAEVPASFVDIVIAFLFVFGVAFLAPFLAGFENIVGLLIIGFGVYQAWKMNNRADFEITGPHSVGPQPAEST